MTVDVLYEGLPLLTGATLREQGDGAFLEWEAPMPVGTRLTLRGPEGERTARVQHVQEGAGAGVVLTCVEGRAPVEQFPAADTNPGEKKGSGKERRKKDRKTAQP
jgi:hypothetical protein